MNLAELREQVSLRAGVPSTDPAYDRIDGFVNQALQGISEAKAGGWDWLIVEFQWATVADQERYLFSDLETDGELIDYGPILSVRSVEYQFDDETWSDPLERRQKAELRALYRGTSDSWLSHYAAEEQAIWLFATPSEVLTMRASVRVAEKDLSADSDTPILPTPYHRVLVSAATGLLLRSLQRYPEAKDEENAAADGLARMLLNAKPYTGAGKIRKTRRP